MYDSNPLRLINTAVNRQTKEGYVIGTSETISVWEALKSLTINAAWQLHQEQKIGSLKQGKYADFVILDKNPLKVDKTKLHTLKVLRTIVHGNTVYQK
jgi:predicted amidohydrolase YtcJ